jgi:hypothetical protein
VTARLRNLFEAGLNEAAAALATIYGRSTLVGCGAEALCN